MDRKYTVMFNGKLAEDDFEKLQKYYMETWLGRDRFENVPEEVAFQYRGKAMLDLTEGWYE